MLLPIFEVQNYVLRLSTFFSRRQQNRTGYHQTLGGTAHCVLPVAALNTAAPAAGGEERTLLLHS